MNSNNIVMEAALNSQLKYLETLESIFSVKDTKKARVRIQNELLNLQTNKQDVLKLHSSICKGLKEREYINLKNQYIIASSFLIFSVLAILLNNQALMLLVLISFTYTSLKTRSIAEYKLVKEEIEKVLHTKNPEPLNEELMISEGNLEDTSQKHVLCKDFESNSNSPLQSYINEQVSILVCERLGYRATPKEKIYLLYKNNLLKQFHEQNGSNIRLTCRFFAFIIGEKSDSINTYFNDLLGSKDRDELKKDTKRFLTSKNKDAIELIEKEVFKGNIPFTE